MARRGKRLRVGLLMIASIWASAGCAGRAGSPFVGSSVSPVITPGISGGLIVPYRIGPGMTPGRR